MNERGVVNYERAGKIIQVTVSLHAWKIMISIIELTATKCHTSSVVQVTILRNAISDVVRINALSVNLSTSFIFES